MRDHPTLPLIQQLIQHATHTRSTVMATALQKQANAVKTATDKKRKQPRDRKGGGAPARGGANNRDHNRNPPSRTGGGEGGDRGGARRSDSPFRGAPAPDSESAGADKREEYNTGHAGDKRGRNPNYKGRNFNPNYKRPNGTGGRR